MRSAFRIGLAAGLLVTSSICRAAENPASAPSELGRKAERELRENILPFWLKYAPDPENGAFHGQLTADLKPVEAAPRGSLLTCRILWAFSAVYRRYREPALLEMAKRAYQDLLTRFWDEQHGGIYWTISKEGKPLDTSKQTYGQVFGIYALSEYYRATFDPQALERATMLYRCVEKYARDPAHGGYFEVFTSDWRKEQPRKSPVNATAAKSQNTHLHVMEAYTNLLRVWPDADLRAALQALVECMLTRIYDARSHHLRLFLTENWTPRSENWSYGHDIEAAWLLTEAAQVLDDTDLIKRTKAVAVEIAEAFLKQGVDHDGGVFNEGGPKGVTDSRKDWWPQAEAMVGLLNAYQISGDNRFLTAAAKTWTFIDKRMIDHERGEWFQSVDDRGPNRLLPKISLWKCPYHNGRACLEVLARVERIESTPPLPPLDAREKANR
ncbi:MAG: AGE family epimerase/isomerase [Nibricoccus sp.]